MRLPLCVKRLASTTNNKCVVFRVNNGSGYFGNQLQLKNKLIAVKTKQ